MCYFKFYSTFCLPLRELCRIAFSPNIHPVLNELLIHFGSSFPFGKFPGKTEGWEKGNRCKLENFVLSPRDSSTDHNTYQVLSDSTMVITLSFNKNPDTQCESDITSSII
ncbi:hypothetical protein WA026_014973 [Henosepilachna vigintioctopunctata]|uniref:Uncharacterized protein n=1 Tax=Henosepilachna vigintioctopunctata TaxID=420089 RepID=A0AAW1U736_9CUCU